MKHLKVLGLVVILAAALGAVVVSTTEGSKQVIPVAVAVVPAEISDAAAPIQNTPTVATSEDTDALAASNIPDTKPPVQPAQSGPWVCSDDNECNLTTPRAAPVPASPAIG